MDTMTLLKCLKCGTATYISSIIKRIRSIVLILFISSQSAEENITIKLLLYDINGGKIFLNTFLQHRHQLHILKTWIPISFQLYNYISHCRVNIIKRIVPAVKFDRISHVQSLYAHLRTHTHQILQYINTSSCFEHHILQ